MVGLALVGIAGVVSVLATMDALATRDHLIRGRDAIRQARPSAPELDLPAVQTALVIARTEIAAAQDRSRTIPMRIIGRIPVAGRSARSLRRVTEAAGAAVDAGFEATRALRAFPISGGRPSYGVSGGRIDLAPWVRASVGLDRAAESAAYARRIADLAPTRFVLPPIQRATEQLQEGLAELDRAARSAADASRLIPSMFGGDGTRRYLVVLQNLGEARAAGGLVGGFAIIEAKQGRLSLLEVSPNANLVVADRDVPMPAWYRTRYDRFASRRLWSNVNMEPDFRVTGPLMAALFERTNGVAVNGVIAMDPVGLQSLVRVTGPVAGPRGITATGDNLARLVMKDAYVLFPGKERTDPDRKQFLADLTTRVYGALIKGSDPQALVGAFGEAARGGHLMVWSAEAHDRGILQRLRIDGGFPEAVTSFVGVYSQNGSANKMDYYMRRDISITAYPERSGLTRYEMNVLLRNTGPRVGLPDYVLGTDTTVTDFSPGLVRSYVSVYLPPSARVDSFVVNGVATPFESERAPHAAIASRYVAVPPRSQASITVSWTTQSVGAADELSLTVLSQPTPVPDKVRFTIVAPGRSVRYATDTEHATGESSRAATLRFGAVLDRGVLRRFLDAFSSL